MILLLGAVRAYAGRNGVFGIDGLAYVDVARAYLRHDWHTAVNGYWGPLYSWLIALGMWVFKPGMWGELALVHGLSFGIFVAALVLFGRFWRSLSAWGTRSGEDCLAAVAPVAWILFGYLMFFVTFTWSLGDVTPDILVAAIVFAIAEQIFRLKSREVSSLKSHLWLGVLLAVGYYAKAILLYFAIFVLAWLLVEALRADAWRKVAATGTVFVVLVAPFVVLVSRTLGHPSAGDSGRLNYAWFVDGPETGTWMTTGKAPVPFYPGAVVFGSPRVFEVFRLDGVTYAPWYDAGRFDRRSRPAFHLRRQILQLAVNLKFLKEQVLEAEAALLVPLLLLVWNSPKTWWRRLAGAGFCVLPALGVVGMYLLVHLVMRFVLGFFLVLWGTALVSCAVTPDFQVWGRRALVVGLLLFAAAEVPGVLHFAVSRPAETADRDVAIAEALPGYGLRPGDAVASLGDGQEAYWAHWDGLAVVAETWKADSGAFWTGSPAQVAGALGAMADAGAKAAVWRRDSDRPCPAGWIGLPGGSGCLVLLPLAPPLAPR